MVKITLSPNYFTTKYQVWINFERYFQLLDNKHSLDVLQWDESADFVLLSQAIKKYLLMFIANQLMEEYFRNLKDLLKRKRKISAPTYLPHYASEPESLRLRTAA